MVAPEEQQCGRRIALLNRAYQESGSSKPVTIARLALRAGSSGRSNVHRNCAVNDIVKILHKLDRVPTAFKTEVPSA